MQLELALGVALFCLGAGDAAPTHGWPQFRGAGALGVAEQGAPPDTWSEHGQTRENIRWKTPVAGRGWSSPIVVGQRVFLTTVINDGDNEKQLPGLYFGGERPKPPESKHRWQVVCLDLDSGKTIWTETVHEGLPQSSIHLKNTFASETPATDGERIFAYFGNLGVYAFDLDGKPLWHKAIGPYRTNAGWGTGASPIVYQGKVILLNDNEEDSFLLALDARSGEELWRVKREDKSNWATPFVWENDRRAEIIASGSGNVRSYDLEGNLLWHLGGMSFNAIPTPFSKFGLLYVTSGHVMGKAKPLIAVKPGASGDISLGENETKNDFIEWSLKGVAPYNPSPLLYGDVIYVLLDPGFVAAYDAHTGETLYTKQRLPGGKAFTASPWGANGHVYCLSEFGETFVLDGGPKFKILHTNKLGDDDMWLASPAIVGDRLLMRSSAAVYCLERTPQSSAGAQ